MIWNITHPFGPRMILFRLHLALDHLAVKAIEIAEALARAVYPHKEVKLIAVLTVDKPTVLPIRFQQSEMPTQQFAVSFQRARF
jgi:hypothetical protein